MNTQSQLSVLFADVAGSTTLYERLGDSMALKLIDQCLDRLRRITAQFNGKVIKTIGDEVMCVFPSADLGMQAASEMQLQVEGIPPVNSVKLAIRIGFHYGPVIEESNDVFGDTVNVAARMAGLAKAGQIITTLGTVSAMTPILRSSTRSVDQVTVKGKQEEIGICEVIWAADSDLTMVSNRIPNNANQPKLKLMHNNIEIRWDDAAVSLSMGRDPSCDIVILDRKASRQHATIERRRDKFVVIDNSTNGTYVTFEGEPEIFLKREESVLRNKGTISFGHRFAEDESEFLTFICL